MSRADDFRMEADSLGPVQVPKDKYYGAQTARALANFKIGRETMPKEMIRALGIVKKAAAMANQALKTLETLKALLSLKTL